MSFFNPPPKPRTQLAYHRVLSPTASVKVSPICLGGISIGNEWSELFGESEDAFALLDQFYELGGNFIDTSNTYNAESSERLIGEWMKARGVRDQMVIATKYTAGYRAYNMKNEPLQSNFTGNSAKSMFVSVRDSLRKLDTDYLDILYVHWWDFTTSVEEVMRHLHTYVMAKQVLYLGVSDTPAWVVVKANECMADALAQILPELDGKWNAAFRDMEAEIIPMCEDQGMGIVPWAALGGGQLLTAEQRKQKEEKHAGQKSFYEPSRDDVAVSRALEKIATDKKTTLQSIALAYLLHQSTYVFPIVGVQTTAHVKAMEDALTVKLSQNEIRAIQDAAPFNPLFPMNFLYSCKEGKGYNLQLNPSEIVQYRMASWIDVPGKTPIYEPRSTFES